MITLADIWRQHGSAYRQQFDSQMLPSHKQAMAAIVRCRTAALGGHVYTCEACDHQEYRYHSCRNRHCPQCQGDKAQQWLARQQEMLLPVPYYLLTFTLPAALRELARSQQRLFYNLLFRASAAATQQLAQDPRFLGGAVGMVGVLHTWGRNLSFHPHVHYLMPAGAWDGQVWRYSRHQRFLLPVKALSILFRAKFRDGLKKHDCFQQIAASIWSQAWVVHSQPVGRGGRALRYLAPYIFRVAISNQRLAAVTEETVTFRYRPSGSREWHLCTVSAFEFIRRFLQHVLPKRFVKVRYYGFFSPGQRQRLAQIRAWFTPPQPTPPSDQPEEIHKKTTKPESFPCCPHCGQPLRPTKTLPPAKQRWQPP